MFCQSEALYGYPSDHIRIRENSTLIFKACDIGYNVIHDTVTLYNLIRKMGPETLVGFKIFKSYLVGR